MKANMHNLAIKAFEDSIPSANWLRAGLAVVERSGKRSVAKDLRVNVTETRHSVHIEMDDSEEGFLANRIRKAIEDSPLYISAYFKYCNLECNNERENDSRLGEIFNQAKYIFDESFSDKFKINGLDEATKYINLLLALIKSRKYQAKKLRVVDKAECVNLDRSRFDKNERWNIIELAMTKTLNDIEQAVQDIVFDVC